MFNRKNKKVSMRTMLVAFHNNFLEKIVGNTLDLARHLDIAESKPDFTRPNQMGQPVPVQDLIKENKANIENSSHYLKVINKLLAMKDVELLDHIDDLKDIEPPKPTPPPVEKELPKKERYEVLKGLEFPKGVTHGKGIILELSEDEASTFAPDLITKVKK